MFKDMFSPRFVLTMLTKIQSDVWLARVGPGFVLNILILVIPTTFGPLLVQLISKAAATWFHKPATSPVHHQPWMIDASTKVPEIGT